MTARWAGASDVVALDTLSAKKLAHSISNAVRVHRAESATARAQARLARYAAQLKGLAETSLEVVGQKSADQLLVTLATRARELVGTHIATVRLLADGPRSLPAHAVSLSDEYAAARGSSREPWGLEALVRDRWGAVRLGRAELETLDVTDSERTPAPLNGWIAAPLVHRDGHTSGLVELADKYHGEFDEHDEAVLIQLAQLGSVALENVGLLEREQAARQLAEQSAWLAEENAERVGRLHRVSVGLAAALSVTDIAREIVRLACPAALAERAALYLAPPERERLVNLAEQRGSATSLPWPAGFGVSDPGPVPRAFRNGRACYLRAWRPRQPRFRNARAQHAAALVILPLRSRGEAAIGVLVLGFAERREFHGADRVFLESLAEHCAQALERARLYEAERHAREQAEAASRLKDEFLATVSHELRTPLQSIWGWSRLLVNDAGAAPRVAQGIQVIERNARSLAHLVDDILDVSRVVTGKLRVVPRPMQLDEVVHAAAETLRVAAEAKRIELSVRAEPGAGAMSGDPDRLQQVVWNLVANAIKFTPPGGHVEVALTGSEGAVVLAVSDDGMGIAPEFLPYVFERFRQADGTSTRAHGGLGLGLSLVRHLVELHGGHVRAQSPGLGRGATFTVVLPIREAVPLDAPLVSGLRHANPGLPAVRDTEAPEGVAVSHAPPGARAPVKAGA
jgi:signal transduction histidine kinase